MTPSTEWLYGVSLWIVFPVSAVALIAAAGLGRWLGRRAAAHGRDDGTGAISGLQGAALGLVTLLISFTFSVALDRYDTRKAFVLEEANALSTVQRRAQMLAQPHASQVGRLLDEYLAVRLTVADGGAGSLRRIAPRSLDLQDRLWREALAVSALDPRSIPNGLFIEAVNALDDTHEKRLTADRSHVPEAVFLLLYALAAVALGLNGYRAGLAGGRPTRASIGMALLFAAVIVQVQDLDRPRRGLITVSQQSMHNLAGEVK